MEPLELFTRRQVLSVSELVGRLKRHTEEGFALVWVEGEVSGLRRPASGHCYFSLKDERASLRAVLFRRQASLLRFKLEEGQQVLCQGRLSVFEPRGEVQLVVETAEPRGAGALALAFAQIKNRLQDEGLLDQERKRPLPDLPTRVAVVTSPSGAAVRDFLKVLHRRFERVQVAIYPVLVQGNQAPGQMIQALTDLAAWGWPQVIVLTRGGGSPEELWAFNDEGLARAIAACPIPVVSAVGHEIDFSISDLVADLRAPTPSAAAELLVRSRDELLRRLGRLDGRLRQGQQRLLARRRELLAHLLRGLGDPRRRLADRRLRVDDLAQRALQAWRFGQQDRGQRLLRLGGRLAAKGPLQRLARLDARRQNLALRLAGTAREHLARRRARLERLASSLRVLGPQAVLQRGYALVSDDQGRLLRAASWVTPGQAIKVRLASGRLGARVEEVEP